ncbi:hypothetical protein PUN28_012925 [Cardiocondyla obscurior]|uniref:Uncharacterized protein n=1 Tax=Cardiocondyla obscurior TaxID=286306 RepID=A0AAW2F7A5_9HYME
MTGLYPGSNETERCRVLEDSINMLFSTLLQREQFTALIPFLFFSLSRTPEKKKTEIEYSCESECANTWESNVQRERGGIMTKKESYKRVSNTSRRVRTLKRKRKIELSVRSKKEKKSCKYFLEGVLSKLLLYRFAFCVQHFTLYTGRKKKSKNCHTEKTQNTPLNIAKYK